MLLVLHLFAEMHVEEGVRVDVVIEAQMVSDGILHEHGIVLGPDQQIRLSLPLRPGSNN